MTPRVFPEANKELQKPPSMTDEECGPLPVYNDGEQSISCWQMTWRERLAALVFGRVWLGVLFGKTQPPVWLMCRRTAVLKQKEPTWHTQSSPLLFQPSHYHFRQWRGQD